MHCEVSVVVGTRSYSHGAQKCIVSVSDPIVILQLQDKLSFFRPAWFTFFPYLLFCTGEKDQIIAVIETFIYIRLHLHFDFSNKRFC